MVLNYTLVGCPCDITVYLHITGSISVLVTKQLCFCENLLARYVIKAPLDYRIHFEWPIGLDIALQVEPLDSVLTLRTDYVLLPATWGRECPEASLSNFLVIKRNAHPRLLIIRLWVTSCIADFAIEWLIARTIDRQYITTAQWTSYHDEACAAI